MTDLAIKNLSPGERLALIGELWDSLDEVDLPVTLAQRSELDQRLETADVDAARGKSWEQILEAWNRRRR